MLQSASRNLRAACDDVFDQPCRQLAAEGFHALEIQLHVRKHDQGLKKERLRVFRTLIDALERGIISHVPPISVEFLVAQFTEGGLREALASEGSAFKLHVLPADGEGVHHCVIADDATRERLATGKIDLWSPVIERRRSTPLANPLASRSH